MFFRKRLFPFSAALFFAVVLMLLSFASCGDSGGDSESSISFNHGVASGDPLSDRVVLWTKVTPPESREEVKVTVEVATDAEFTDLVGETVMTTTTAERDYTVKVDFTGLKAGIPYYYRFRSDGVTSPVGRTKTLPQGDVSSVKLAVFSCANYAAGYFNVYGHAAGQADVDAVLHLGDYIYEYDTRGLSLENSGEVVRNLPADNDKEILTLDDYRKRYAVYRSDSQLQALHAAHPFITMWDDHEVANNSYKDGASNHDEGEGEFRKARKEAAASQAYYEWMPIRENTQEREIAYRSFSFGNLVDLHMLETRLVARDKELDYQNYIDPETETIDMQMLNTHLQSQTLLGRAQLEWLREGMNDSSATWQVLGQQVLMGRMELPVELLAHLDNPSLRLATDIFELTEIKQRVQGNDPSVTQRERDRINTVLPYNLDAWDGYPAEREAVLGVAYSADKNLVVLAGDTHNGWANNLEDAEGNQVGVEFAGPSVTSGGIEDFLGLPDGFRAQFSRAVETLVDDLVYSNASDRGYMIVSFTSKEAQSEWIYVDTVSELEFDEKSSASKVFKVLPGTGNRRLVSQ